MFCKKCGKEIDDNAAFCPACGTPVNQPQPQPQPMMIASSPKNKWIAFALCLFGIIFPFLSGLQRFYVGKVGTGILYLCTAGIFGIGSIIDIIKILVGSFQDSNGLCLK